MKYEEAILAAHSMIDYLRPACIGHDTQDEKIAIAGSLRRGVNKDYDEIDLIMIPDLTPPPLPRAEFGKPVPKVYKTKVDQLLGSLEEEGKIRLGSYGPRAKKFAPLSNSIRFDLYLVFPPATWGVQFVIRTGPSDFSHWIVSRRSSRAVSPDGRRGGALPDGYRVQGGAVWEGERAVPDKELLNLSPVGFETEEGFLDWLGLGWIEPEDRVAKWMG